MVMPAGGWLAALSSRLPGWIQGSDAGEPERGQTARDVLGRFFEDPNAWVFRENAILENWQWIGLLALVFGGVVLERLARMLCYGVARRFGRSGRNYR